MINNNSVEPVYYFLLFLSDVTTILFYFLSLHIPRLKNILLL